MVAAGVVAVAAIAAATGVLPGEATLRAAVRGVSSAEIRRLARAIRPLGTWWGLVPESCCSSPPPATPADGGGCGAQSSSLRP